MPGGDAIADAQLVLAQERRTRRREAVGHDRQDRRSRLPRFAFILIARTAEVMAKHKPE